MHARGVQASQARDASQIIKIRGQNLPPTLLHFLQTALLLLSKPITCLKKRLCVCFSARKGCKIVSFSNNKMHGRKRQTQPPSPEQTAATQAKLETYKKLAQTAIQQRLANACSPEVFELNGKLCAANPDVYSLWNHRREMLMQFETDKDTIALKALVGGELTVSAAAIQKNPKSYPAWQHRQWVVTRYHVSGVPVSQEGEGAQASSKGQVVDVSAELGLCGKLLDADERNFHCWNYRMWLTRSTSVPVEQELEYTTQRIHKNFSNYSAWHQRSHLLLSMHGASSDALLPLSTLRPELDLIRQAVYTEPDDQSPWFYRRWVVAQAWTWVGQGSHAEACQAIRLLLDDLDPIRELCALEPSAKWPLMAVAEALALLQSTEARSLASGSAFEEQITISVAEKAGMLGTQDEDKDGDPLHATWRVGRLYDALRDLDPRHAAYYDHMLAKVQATQGTG